MMHLSVVEPILERLEIDYSRLTDNLWLRKRDGTLLRTFTIHRDNYIDLHDFRKWLEYYENIC